jgi:hypothetical protein
LVFRLELFLFDLLFGDFDGFKVDFDGCLKGVAIDHEDPFDFELLE